MNMRLPIVIGMYAFIVVFLPRNPAVDRLFDKVRMIDPNVAISVSVAGLLLACLFLWLMWRQPKGWLRRRPSRKLIVVNSGLILVPIAFMAAEGAYLALEWRLNRKFDKE